MLKININYFIYIFKLYYNYKWLLTSIFLECMKKSMKYSRLSKYKIKKIMKCFSEDITASSTSILLCINRNTINSYYNKFRELLLDHSLRITGKEF